MNLQVPGGRHRPAQAAGVDTCLSEVITARNAQC